MNEPSGQHFERGKPVEIPNDFRVTNQVAELWKRASELLLDRPPPSITNRPDSKPEVITMGRF